MVQGVARPDQVGLAQPAEVFRQFGLQGLEAVDHSETSRAVLRTLQESGRGIHRHHLGLREDLGQQTGDDAGAAADVQDPADLRRGGQGGDPAGRLLVLCGVEFGLLLQQGAQDVPVDVRRRIAARSVRMGMHVGVYGHGGCGRGGRGRVVVAVTGVAAHGVSLAEGRPPGNLLCRSGKSRWSSGGLPRYSCGLTPLTRLNAALKAKGVL